MQFFPILLQKRGCHMAKPKHSTRDSNKGEQPPREATTIIVRQPSESELAPTETERRLLQDLFDWQERSRETHWILEQPLGVRTQ